MCGPYAHGYYFAEEDAILCDYLRWNAHGEVRQRIPVDGFAPEMLPNGAVLYHEVGQAGHRMFWEAPAPPSAIPYGIIPATGEVVVQRNGGPKILARHMVRMPSGWLSMSNHASVPTELSGRAKRRIRATWDLEVWNVARLIEWIEAHYGKRNDQLEWVAESPKLLCRGAQRRFFPIWVKGAEYAWKESWDHRRICEALRRGGANDFWQRAAHENRRANAEKLLAGVN